MEKRSKNISNASSVAEFCALWDNLSTSEATKHLPLRPLLLSDLLIKEIPEDDSVWIARAELFQNRKRKLEELTRATEFCQSPRIYAAIAGLYFANGQLELGRATFDAAFRRRWRSAEAGFLWLSWSALDTSQSQSILLKGVQSCRDGDLWTCYVRNAPISEKYDIFLKACDKRTLTLNGLSDIISSLDSTSLKMRVYEKCLRVFPSKLQIELWRMYLEDFPEKDLFEQAISRHPHDMKLWLSFAASRASKIDRLAVLKKALWSVAPQNRPDLVQYMLKLSPFETTYVESLESLNDRDANYLSQDLAVYEEKHNNPQRARAAYSYASVFNDPLTAAGSIFWNKWADFETRNGTSETQRQFEAEKSAVALAIGSDPLRCASRDKEVKFVMEGTS